MGPWRAIEMPLSVRVLTPLLLASMSAAATPQIPLCPGLTVVTAVSQSSGDYESIKTIQVAGPKEIRMKYTAEGVNSDQLSPTFGQVVTNTTYRKLLREDLASATLYQQVFPAGVEADELIPGTTAIGTSSQVLGALRTKGESPFSISLLPPATPLRANREVRPHAYDFFTAGTLARVGTVKVPVLVNNRLTELTAIQARGEFAGEKSEFLFLDDDANPLTLRFRLGIDALPAMRPELAETCAYLRKHQKVLTDNQCLEHPKDRDALQVIKISYGCAAPPPPAGGDGGGGAGQAPDIKGGPAGSGAGMEALEQALEKTGKADIYSIYFSFNSAEIREESEQMLKDIAALMRKHPDWKLSIYGHTDSIASDKYNLELSQRRAAAVSKALTTQHGVAANRLSYAGQGEASPKDTNDTLEGRAKNRRVELVRL